MKMMMMKIKMIIMMMKMRKTRMKAKETLKNCLNWPNLVLKT